MSRDLVRLVLIMFNEWEVCVINELFSSRGGVGL